MQQRDPNIAPIGTYYTKNCAETNLRGDTIKKHKGEPNIAPIGTYITED